MFQLSARLRGSMFTTKTLQFNIVQFRHLSLKRRRPMVHLSSAPNQKFRGKAIGNSHPIRPHEITKRQEVPSEIKKPSYAANGKIPKVEPGLALHNSESIGKIKKSCHLAAEILDLACCMAKEGVTTNEIDEIVHEAIVNRGGYPSTLNYNGFPKSICLSVNEVACHGIPDMRPLRSGDLVSLDVSVYLDGYHGDNCRTVLVQKETPTEMVTIDTDDEDHIQRATLIMEATEEALLEAISVCHAGVEISEIGRVTHEIAERYGFRPLKNICGHGVGRHLHMLPEVKHYRNKDTQVLEAGMVLTIEPTFVEGHHAHIIWDDGWTVSTVDGGLAAQFEHTILVKESGPPDILTTI